VVQVLENLYRQGWWLAVGQGEEFDRGVAAGVIAERLDQHDKHFAQINGSLAHVSEEMHTVALTLQQLANQASSREETAEAVVEALKESNVSRATLSEQRFRPWQRTGFLIGAAFGLVSIATTIILLFNN
jgi:methyl-accepting chemotaxis protein